MTRHEKMNRISQNADNNLTNFLKFNSMNDVWQTTCRESSSIGTCRSRSMPRILSVMKTRLNGRSAKTTKFGRVRATKRINPLERRRVKAKTVRCNSRMIRWLSTNEVHKKRTDENDNQRLFAKVRPRIKCADKFFSFFATRNVEWGWFKRRL